MKRTVYKLKENKTRYETIIIVDMITEIVVENVSGDDFDYHATIYFGGEQEGVTKEEYDDIMKLLQGEDTSQNIDEDEFEKEFSGN